MAEPLAQRAGTAISWKALQHGGTKLIYLLRLVIVARLLSPDDFGLLAIAGVAIDVLLQITNVGVIPALVQRERAHPRHYDVAWTLGLTRAFLITATVLLVAPLVADFFAEPRATPLIRVLALRPLLQAAVSIKVARLTRRLDFRSLAFIEMPEAVINTVTTILLAKSLGVWALVAGSFAGLTGTLVLSYILAPHRPRLSFDRPAAQELIRFGRWIFLTSLLSVAGTFILRAVISRSMGATELGLYYLAASLAFLPTEITAEIVGTVAFPLFSRVQKDLAQAERAFRSLLTALVALILPACALLIALAPSLVDDVLGGRWVGAAPIIQALALVNLLGLLGELAAPVFRGMGRPQWVAALEALQSAVLIGLVWFLVDRYGAFAGALAWLGAAASSQLLSAFFLRRILPQPMAGLSRPLGAIAVIGLVGAGLSAAVDRLLPTLTGLLLAGALGVGVTGALLGVADRWLSLGLWRDFSLAFPQLAARLRRIAPTGDSA